MSAASLRLLYRPRGTWLQAGTSPKLAHTFGCAHRPSR